MVKSIKRQLTRQLLLDSGLEQFIKNGYKSTSIDDLLRELDLTKGAFYYHFDSKESFMIAIIEEVVSKKIYAELINPLDQVGDASTIIFEAIEKNLKALENKGQSYGLMLGNFLHDFGKNDTVIASKLINIINHWKLALVKCLQSSKTNGFINRHVDSEAIASFIIASYIGLRSLKKFDSDVILHYKYLSQLKNYLYSLRNRG